LTEIIVFVSEFPAAEIVSDIPAESPETSAKLSVLAPAGTVSVVAVETVLSPVVAWQRLPLRV
jgi:hypothetical protein